MSTSHTVPMTTRPASVESPIHRAVPSSPAGSSRADRLLAVLTVERSGAEATLGRALIDPLAFAAEVLSDGLGEALNREHDRVDQLPQAGI